MSRSLLLSVVSLAVLCISVAHLSMPMRRHTMAGPHSVPVGGNIYPVAIFYAAVQIGTPPHSYMVALDTGSSDLIIPQKGCDGCVKGAPSYDPSASSTSQKKHCTFSQCKFSNTYQTCDPSHPTEPCTVKGLVYEDQFSIGGLATTVTFGAINYQTSNFVQFQVVDGVIGLAGTMGQFGDVPAIQKLYDNGVIQQNVFAMCFRGNNGTFTVGGIDTRMYHGAIAYTPNAGAGQGFYILDLEGIQVGSQTVPNSADPSTILDSGTNVLLLPTGLFNNLRQTFELMCQSNNMTGVCGESPSLFDGACFAMTPAEIAAFPNITLNLANDVQLSVSGADYLLIENQPGKYCLGVLPTGSDGFLIVGDIIMQNYYTIFNQQTNQIGWAAVNKANCIGTN